MSRDSNVKCSMKEEGYMIRRTNADFAHCFSHLVFNQPDSGTKDSPNFIPTVGAHVVASKATAHIEYGLSAINLAWFCLNVILSCARTTP